MELKKAIFFVPTVAIREASDPGGLNIPPRSGEKSNWRGRGIAMFAERLDQNGLVIVTVVENHKPQTFHARVDRIYSARQGLQAVAQGDMIEFVGCPEHWGQIGLRSGERALVFLSKLPGGFYEHHWRGHLILEEIDGVLHAALQDPSGQFLKGAPSELQASWMHRPDRPYYTAVRFDVLEQYVVELIGQEG